MADGSKAASGAVAGAGTGAMVGSVVPGVGTAIGAGVGAVAGALPGLLDNGPAPINTNYQYNNDGTINGYGIGYDNFQSPWMQNPMDVNPYTSDPYAGQQLSGLQGLQGYQGQIMGEAFDPSYYNNLKANAMTSQTMGIDNQYAKMGLAGSSANLGADQTANQSLNQYYLNRQMGDQEHAIQGSAGLYNQSLNGIMGLQGMYGGFQSSLMDNLVSLHNGQQQQQAANNQMWGNMMGSAMNAGASYAGMKAMANS